MNENELIYSFATEHVIEASGLIALMLSQTLGAGLGVKRLVATTASATAFCKGCSASHLSKSPA